MTDDEEKAYLEGSKAAWLRIMDQAAHELASIGAPDAAPLVQANGWIQERAAVVRALRELCAELGDNDWEDDLHLGDVIEKHLVCHLELDG